MTRGVRVVAVAVVLAAAGGCSPSAATGARTGGAPAQPAARAPAEVEPSGASPVVPPEIEALLAAALRRDPRSTGQDYPACPPLTPELKRGVAREVDRSSAVRAALVELDPGHDNNTMFDAVAVLQRERAVFALAAGVCHDSDDVKIKSARALAALADPAPVSFLLEVAQKLAVYEAGSENATLHGVIQHALAAALNAMTGARVVLRDGQDPDGLTAGIDSWRRASSSAR